MRWSEQTVQLPSSAWAHGGSKLQVLLSPETIESVRRHLGSQPREQGGLLLGRLFHQPPQAAATGARHIVAVAVEDAVPALDGIGSEISLTMPASVWSAARKQQGVDQVIVGWYHSHPGIGAFFSSTDRQTQAAFFTQPWSLGWVIDPLRGEQAWFAGPQSEALSADQLLLAPPTQFNQTR